MRDYRVPTGVGGSMETIYDWVSLGIFAGLIVLFLQRSTSDRAERDALHAGDDRVTIEHLIGARATAGGTRG